ncbi:MAG: hypothetical protein AAFU79_08640 [Myxococcota bacterium]
MFGKSTLALRLIGFALSAGLPAGLGAPAAAASEPLQVRIWSGFRWRSQSARGSEEVAFGAAVVVGWDALFEAFRSPPRLPVCVVEPLEKLPKGGLQGSLLELAHRERARVLGCGR